MRFGPDKPLKLDSGAVLTDFQIGYRFPDAGPFRNARLALSATNIFDRAPPYVNNHAFDSTLAYDPEQASPVGRLISVQARFGW